ncbi:MAG: SDR family NAD(P)-dependent oxidoreductase [Sphingobium sp.]|uniref:SDR family NAD(P)-dependent oxidoreductase n=1 Tax=Sphingobium sp. TaxID=1912891 RepID=UPI0029BD6E27|nr:SDR family NAD(P)-dependent oxidoreductase [Sphingobium sp.]MDX3910607.1 SDR family NAD(P)-dependent oxidoreductase [Sphingobium sp.]
MGRRESLKITDDASTRTCVETIVAREGRIDVLMNNAGYGSYGPVEDVPSKRRGQFEVNIFGHARVIHWCCAKVRENRYGKVVNITSVGERSKSPLAPGTTPPNMRWRAGRTRCGSNRRPSTLTL